MPTPYGLNLTADQGEVFSDLKIDPKKLYFIDNDLLPNATTLRVNGYCSGHYVVFVEGEESDHRAFLQSLYGSQFAAPLITKARGITIYGSPSWRFAKDENLVTVGIAAVG
jgi:hypothetical protein